MEYVNPKIIFLEEQVESLERTISKLDSELNRANMSKYVLAYYLIEAELKDKLEMPYNELVNTIPLSREIKVILNENGFPDYRLKDIIAVVKNIWDAAHYEAK